MILISQICMAGTAGTRLVENQVLTTGSQQETAALDKIIMGTVHHMNIVIRVTHVLDMVSL